MTTRSSQPEAEPDNGGTPYTTAVHLRVGQPVAWAGHAGTVQFVGETQFAAGIWVGVELEEKIGRNNGSVRGVRYFTCSADYGIFVRPGMVEPREDDTGTSVAMTLTTTSAEPEAEAETICGGTASTSDVNFWLGQQVSVTGWVGTVRYVGTTQFAPGFWVGIELEERRGKNNGSIAGVRYFTCSADHGVFVCPNMVEAREDSSGTPVLMTQVALAGAVQGQSLPGDVIEAVSSTTTSTQPEAEPDNGGTPYTSAIHLRVGQQVAVLGRCAGTVRFVGETQFAAGIWVGVELEEQIGRNNGSVRGVRYFTCSADYGIFVRPGMVEPREDDTGTSVAMTLTTTSAQPEAEPE